MDYIWEYSPEEVGNAMRAIVDRLSAQTSSIVCATDTLRERQVVQTRLALDGYTSEEIDSIFRMCADRGIPLDDTIDYLEHVRESVLIGEPIYNSTIDDISKVAMVAFNRPAEPRSKPMTLEELDRLLEEEKRADEI